jgi:hypothetical protein
MIGPDLPLQPGFTHLDLAFQAHLLSPSEFYQRPGSVTMILIMCPSCEPKGPTREQGMARPGGPYEGVPLAQNGS